MALWLSQRRRTLLRLLKREEKVRTGTLPAQLRAYSRRFNLEFRSLPPRPCDLRRVESAVAAAQILLSADYHASPRPERTHLRWLRLLGRSGRPVTVALELVSSRHQRALDAFARGRLSEAGFLRRIRFKSEWGFAWPPYRRLLREALALGCRVLALDHPERSRGVSVGARDRHAGELLAAEIARRPQRAILVVSGEMHLAQPHLPRALKRACRRLDVRPRIVTLFHDSEALYFKLGREGLEGQVAALAMGGERYCLLEAAPWVRLLAHLHWLESQESEAHAEDPDDSVVLWTARTLARLAGAPAPGRIHPPAEPAIIPLSLPERISQRAVRLLEATAGPALKISPGTRPLWLALARCLVDPPHPGESRALTRPELAGVDLYRGLVEGRMGAAAVRNALAGALHGAVSRSAAASRS